MPVDNEIYNRAGSRWRDENHPLSLLVGLTPPRVAYLHDVLTVKLGLDPRGKAALDVGCGGGLMAEEVARLGCRVTGVDPSEPSLAFARDHARAEGLAIDYRAGSGERLPVDDAAFDIVYCYDVLEHVTDLDAVIGEAARALKPGGVYIYDTINRTVASWVVAILIMQDWPATSVLPPHLHAWDRFVAPAELRAALAHHGLQPREVTGMVPTGNPIALLRQFRLRKRGEITYGALGRYLAAHLKIGGSTAGSYLGYAVKP